MTIQVYIPLVMEQFAPQTAESVIELLEGIGCTVILKENQTSCGEEIFRSGYVDDAREVAEKFLKDFDNTLPLVVPSVDTYKFLKNDFLSLFANSSLHLKSKELVENTYELAQFLVEKLSIINFNKELDEMAIVHTSSSFESGYEATKNIKELLGGIKGLEAKYTNASCGIRESLYLNPKIGKQISTSFKANVLLTDIKLLIVDDPLSLLNLKKVFRDSDIEVKYFSELLN